MIGFPADGPDPEAELDDNRARLGEREHPALLCSKRLHGALGSSHPTIGHHGNILTAICSDFCHSLLSHFVSPSFSGTRCRALV